MEGNRDFEIANDVECGEENAQHPIRSTGRSTEPARQPAGIRELRPDEWMAVSGGIVYTGSYD